MACALSSITNKLCFDAIFIIASISAHCPNKCTGTIAFVLGVIAASIAAGSMVNVLGLTSTNTGVSFSKAITSAVAT